MIKTNKPQDNQANPGTSEQYAGAQGTQAKPRRLKDLIAGRSQKVTYNTGKPEEELSKIHETATQACVDIKRANPTVTSVGTTLITSETGLALPVLAIYTISEGILYFYTVMFYKWMNKSVLPNLIENVGGREIIKDLSPTKIFNKQLTEIVIAAIRAEAEGEIRNAQPVGYSLVNEDVDLQDEQIANAFVESSVLALRSSIGEFQNWNAQELVDVNASLENSVEIAPGSTSLDAIGQPVPHDFSTHLDIVDPAESNSDQMHQGNSSVRLATAKGIIDFVHTPKANNNMYQAQQQQGFEAPYTAHLIITETGNIGEDVSETNENLLSQLMAVASLGSLTDGSNFIDILNTMTPGKASTGALGLEYDPETGGRPAKPAALKLAQAHAGIPQTQPSVYNMADHFFAGNRLMVSMDIKMGGRLEWVQSTFQRAAENNPVANKAIIKCIDDFTGGQFTKIWGDKRVMFGEPAYLTDGVHYGKDGEVRNVRDFDRLRMLEVSKGSPELMAAYSAAHTPCYNDLVAMHDYREKVLKNILSGFKPQGIICRTTFAPGFIRAFQDSITAAGLRINMQGTGLNSGVSGVSSFDSSSFETSTAPNSLYSYAPSQANTMAYQHNPYGNFNQ